MRAIVTGLPFGVGPPLLQRFASRLGHQVRPVWGADTPIPGGFGPDEPCAAFLGRLAQEPAAGAADALVVWNPELQPTPARIQDAPLPTCAVVSDWNIYYQQLELNLARFDVVVMDRLGAETVRPPGAVPRFVMPLYSQDTAVHRPHAVPKDIDILFVGNLNHAIHRERAWILEQVALLGRRFRVVIGGGAYGDEYARLVSRARIVLNHSVRREMNMRCFEAPACGAALFLEESNLEARDLMRAGEEVVFYRPDNVVALLERHLAEGSRLERIRAQGLALAPSLAGEHRLDTLLEWLARQPRGERRFHAFEPVVRAIADAAQLRHMQDLPRRRLLRARVEALAAAHPQRVDALVAAADLILVPVPPATQPAPAEVLLARRWLERATALAPGEALPHLNLALLAGVLGDARAERRHLEAALGAAGLSMAAWLTAPMNDAWAMRWRRAAACGEATASLLRAGASLRLAEHLFGAGDFEGAARVARDSHTLDPTLAEAYRVRAAAEHRLGRSELATELLLAALPVTTFDRRYREDLLALLAHCGRTGEARAIAEESALLFASCLGGEAARAAFETWMERLPQA